MQLRMRVLGLASILAFVCITGVAQAQQRRGFSRGSSVLRTAAISEVATELKLTDEQTKLATTLNEESSKQRQELFQGFRDLSEEERQKRFQTSREQRAEKEKQLAESIGKEKLQRIKQLGLQAGGELSAFFDRQAAEKLEITDAQRTQAREALSGFGDQFRAARDNADGLAKLITDVNEKLADVLTDAQKSKWKELQGKPASDELLAKIRAASSRGRRRSN